MSEDDQAARLEYNAPFQEGFMRTGPALVAVLFDIREQLA